VLQQAQQTPEGGDVGVDNKEPFAINAADAGMTNDCCLSFNGTGIRSLLI